MSESKNQQTEESKQDVAANPGSPENGQHPADALMARIVEPYKNPTVFMIADPLNQTSSVEARLIHLLDQVIDHAKENHLATPNQMANVAKLFYLKYGEK